MIMGALGFLEGRRNAGNRHVPSEDEINQFLSGESNGSTFVYLCRCGSHPRIVRAIQQAAKEMCTDGSHIDTPAVISRAGTLAVAFSFAPTLARSVPMSMGAQAAGGPADLAVDSWLVIGADNSVTIYSGKVDLGTGVQTALTQIVAEELYLDIGQISFVQGDTSLTPGDQGYTAGSQTIQSEGPKLRIAAATAYQALPISPQNRSVCRATRSRRGTVRSASGTT